MSCKDKCDSYKAFSRPKQGWYTTNHKRCRSCRIFLKWEGLYCPCCGRRLTCRPKNNKQRKKEVFRH